MLSAHLSLEFTVVIKQAAVTTLFKEEKTLG